MVHIVFYEKRGCINNTKQKKLLVDAGHQVESRDLLSETWSRESLLEYFETIPLSMWFNSSAPDIKSGLIDPETLGENDMLELMLNNPILIRRPLMRVADECRVGFEIEWVDQWIGLAAITDKEDLQTCPQQPGHNCNVPAVKT